MATEFYTRFDKFQRSHRGKVIGSRAVGVIAVIITLQFIIYNTGYTTYSVFKSTLCIRFPVRVCRPCLSITGGRVRLHTLELFFFPTSMRTQSQYYGHHRARNAVTFETRDECRITYIISRRSETATVACDFSGSGRQGIT